MVAAGAKPKITLGFGSVLGRTEYEFKFLHE
jgi:hypothetical protein